MAILKIKVKKISLIIWSLSSVDFLRGENSSKIASVNYSDAEGQMLSANQVLYQEGNYGELNYIRVSSVNDVTLNGSGSVSLKVEHYPNDTQANKIIGFTQFGGGLNIQLIYNSKPVSSDVEIEIPNRSTKVFTRDNFIYSDYDGDAITEIQINGDVSGYKYAGENYEAGDWITLEDIDAGLLTYVALDQAEYYEKNNDWKVRDSQGNISG